MRSDDGTLDGITLGISEGLLLGWNDGLLEGGWGLMMVHGLLEGG